MGSELHSECLQVFVLHPRIGRLGACAGAERSIVQEAG
jgi:hypothetical protein